MDHIENGRLAFVKNGDTWIPARVEEYRKLFAYCYRFKSALNPNGSFDCTKEEILQCSVNMYNMVCKNMNAPILTDFTDVEPDDELHAGDFVLIGAEWDRPARVVSSEHWPGGMVYHLIDETGDNLRTLYKRDELVHVSETEYLKHCPGSSTYVSLDSIIKKERLNSHLQSDEILANITRVDAGATRRMKMAKDRIPDNYLVAFLCQDTGDLTPGIVVSCTTNGTHTVSVPPFWCTFKIDDELMVISPKTYNLIVDRLNYKITKGPFFEYINEDAYIQNDTLHPGDCVILMDNSGAATVQEVCCENGEYLYRLENINNEWLGRKYKRHELIKVSVHEYCKHLKHSTCYLDYLERIYMTAEATEIVVSEEPEFVVVGPIGNRIPGIRLSTFTGNGTRCSRVLLYNGKQNNYPINNITPITRSNYDILVAQTSGDGIKMYSGALPSWIGKMNGFQKLADRLAEIIKVQQEIEEKRKMKKLSPKYKVGDMVYWAYCSHNDNKLPAYVRKVAWDDLCGTWRYVMVMANGAVTGEIAEHAVKPCTDEEEFDIVVEQTSGVLDQEDSWMSWQNLVEHVKNMDSNKVVCASCGNEVCIEDAHHCEDCDQHFCDDCWGDHDCSEDYDEDEDTVECECCGKEIPESESVVCPDCEKTLCDKCLGSSHGCTDEDDEDEEEEYDKPDPKPELTAEEAVRRWMGKA